MYRMHEKNDVRNIHLRALGMSPQINKLTHSHSLYIFFFLFFFFLGLCWVFVGARGLSLVAVSRGYSLLPYAGFSLWWLFLLWSTGSRHMGFYSCGSRALERRLSSCGTLGLVALRHVGSSQTRARTRVPCIGRQILNHCATREAAHYIFLDAFLQLIMAHSSSYPPKTMVRLKLIDRAGVEGIPDSTMNHWFGHVMYLVLVH